MTPVRRKLLNASAALGALLAVAVTGAACDQVATQGAPGASAQQLRAAATDPDVKAFYEARQWRSAWTDDSAKALLAALNAAPQHGLDPSAFVGIIKAAQGDASRDVQLTQAALSYARALARGVVDPTKVLEIYTLDRPKDDLTAGLGQALDSGRLGPWLASLAPADAEYQALSQAYLAYRTLSAQAAAAPIPAGAPIRSGGQDPRVPVIAQRLALTGYLPAPGDAVAPVFTAQMATALKSLQRDAGLPATGRVDDATVEALNEAPADRARQLAVNLERRRWLARTPAETRIDVNTASAQMVYFQGGQQAWAGRVVVGAPDHQTPELGETFKQLIVNPPWNVPDGIAKEEILPKGDAYLSSHDMYVEDGHVVQRPGPQTALGAVKFDMQNRYAIYLHDTPSKSLFANDERHLSHGCVRVDKAVEFARLLAASQGVADKFDADLATGETRTVPLAQPIAVRLLYHTTYMGPDGKLIFADDRYGWDDKVGQAMGMAPAQRRGAVSTVAAVMGP